MKPTDTIETETRACFTCDYIWTFTKDRPRAYCPRCEKEGLADTCGPHHAALVVMGFWVSATIEPWFEPRWTVIVTDTLTGDQRGHNYIWPNATKEMVVEAFCKQIINDENISRSLR